MKIHLNKDDRYQFISQLEKDVKFFQQNEIIDYSLLIGYSPNGILNIYKTDKINFFIIFYFFPPSPLLKIR